jgi:predicted secreted acid phosphatase
LKFSKVLFLVNFLSMMVSCCNHSDKPINLTTAREEVKQYYTSGKFDKELTKVISEAKEKFSKVEIKSNSVVIFDIDETALNNFGLAEKMGFGYVYQVNKEWNAEAKTPAFPQVKELYDFLLSKGAKIIFLTARNFPEYEATYKNLKFVGYTVFDTLITQIGDEKKLGNGEFKTAKRIELTKKGYDIIGTVGDQWSDLEGEDHGIQVKIPNYLYLAKD